MNTPGAKTREGIFQTIINQMPPHTIYCEPFLGSGAVMNHKLPAALNIGLDRDPRAIQRARRRLTRKHARAADATTPSRFLCSLANSLDWDLRSLKPASPPAYRFEAADAFEFLRDLKAHPLTIAAAPIPRADILIYCDPPYLLETRAGHSQLYDHELSDWQHIALLKLLRSLKPAMIAVTAYPSNIYRKLLHDWRCVPFQNTTRAGRVVTEHLWCNYPQPETLHDYRHIGRNFRDRERIRRVQRTLIEKLQRLPAIERHALLIEAARSLIA